jgi:hypothetical protein
MLHLVPKVLGDEGAATGAAPTERVVGGGRGDELGQAAVVASTSDRFDAGDGDKLWA